MSDKPTFKVVANRWWTITHPDLGGPLAVVAASAYDALLEERDELRRELDHALETLGQTAKEWATGDAAERVKVERDGLRAELKECEITIEKLDEACDNLLSQRRHLRAELAGALSELKHANHMRDFIEANRDQLRLDKAQALEEVERLKEYIVADYERPVKGKNDE